MNSGNVHPYDVLIIGGGLTGAWAAKDLAEAGFSVLVVDAGPLLAPEQAIASSISQRTPTATRRQPVQSQIAAYWSNPPYLFVDDFEHPYAVVANSPFTWIRGRQVGGRSLTWGGVALRLSDHEFRDPERDGVGPRWPIGYADLAPYYDRVERFLGVSGCAHGLSQLPDGVFLAPSLMTAAEIAFKSQVETRWPDRHVISCRGIATAGDPVPNGEARWSSKSALYRLLPTALSTGRTTIRPDTIVSHLTVDPSTGRVTGAACIDRLTRASFEVRARIVVLSASTIESVRLLLNSRSPVHPSGIGNSTGLVGRGLVDHCAIRLAGPFESGEYEPPRPLGGPNAISIPRFRNLEDCGRSPFIRGYGIWGGINRRPADSPSTMQPAWSLTALLEVIPNESNRIELDTSLKDAWGITTVRILVTYSTNEWRMADDAVAALESLAHTARLDVRHRSVSGPGAYVHEVGGARMGSGANVSVLNSFNQCWDAPNLFVVDGSCFVTAGWQHPTLTMMALSARACAFITDEARRGNI